MNQLLTALSVFCVAIKTGRYSYQKRAQNIMEVKGLTTLETQTRSHIRKDDSSKGKTKLPKILPKDVNVEINLKDAEMNVKDVEIQAAKSAAVSSPDSSQQPLTVPSSEKDLEDIIKRITDVHLKNTAFTPEFAVQKLENERRYLVCVFMFLQYSSLVQVFRHWGFQIDREMLFLSCVSKF